MMAGSVGGTPQGPVDGAVVDLAGHPAWQARAGQRQDVALSRLVAETGALATEAHARAAGLRGKLLARGDLEAAHRVLVAANALSDLSAALGGCLEVARGDPARAARFLDEILLALAQADRLLSTVKA
jgi:hypothetical protein